MTHEVVDLFEDYVDDFIALYNETPHHNPDQYYNVVGAEYSYYGVPPDHPALQELKERVGWYEIDSVFFLKYGPGSYTKTHMDNPDASKYTAVVALDVHELEGGRTYVKDGWATDKTYVDLKTGQCIIYPHETIHGVTEVTSGHRLVMVIWIK